MQRPLFSTANIASPRYSARVRRVQSPCAHHRTLPKNKFSRSHREGRRARVEERLYSCRREGKSKRKTEKEQTRVSGGSRGTVTRALVGARK